MIPLRLYVYAAGALALLGLLWYAHHAVYQDGYEDAQAAFKAELEAQREHQREINEESDRVHQESLAKVRADADRERRGRSIRCVLGSDGQVRIPETTGSPDASTPGGQPAMQSAPDLRSAIVQRGETCEQLRQQVIALQGWITSVRQSSP